MTSFRTWRHGRPFWAGLFAFFGGLELLLLPLAPMAVVIHEGIAGVSGILMGILMMLLGLSMWFAPTYRGFAGIATALFAVASLILSNFGGFGIGMILGMLGGALSFAWTPREPLAASGGGEPATVDSAERADQSGDTDTDSTQAIPRQFPPSDGGNSARHGVGSSW